MEDLNILKKHIPNYEDLNEEERIMALEKIYRKQQIGRSIPRTLQEIIEKQMGENNEAGKTS